MSDFQLPNQAVRNRAYIERGREDVILIDVMAIRDGGRLNMIFEDANSPWRQGVWIRTDGSLRVNEQSASSIQVWKDSAPGEVLIECSTRNGLVHLYNIWDKGNGPESQSWSSGMLVEELPNGRRYHCNDVGFNTQFDKLLFRIERV